MTTKTWRLSVVFVTTACVTSLFLFGSRSNSQWHGNGGSQGTAMQINFAAIPQELQERAQWVLWKTVNRDGRPTKVPFRSDGGPARSNDPTTWGEFEDVVSRSEDFDGIGYVFHPNDPYCGIDLDGCRAADGTVAEWAREIVIRLGSYAEVSPSGTGVKIWVRAKWGHDKHKIELDYEPVSDKKPAIEVYDSVRYFAVTGNRLRGMTEIQDRQAEVNALFAEFWPDNTPNTAGVDFRSDDAVFERARKYLAKLPPSISGQSGHNAAFHAACVVCLGFGMSEPDATALLQEWNQSCQPPWSDKELQHKIRSAMKQPGDRNYLRNVEQKNFAKIEIPKYEPPKPKRQPKQTTLRDAAHEYLENLRNGSGSLIKTGIPNLDEAIGGGIAAGEFVLLAARPSHGKSAVALQMVHYWTDRGLPCAFVSEEMSAAFLGKRVVSFASDVPEEMWTAMSKDVAEQIEMHFHNRSQCVVIEQCATAEAAAEAIRQAKSDHDIKCAVVDYAQLLKSPGHGKYEQVSNTSITLKQVASETGVSLIVLCQMNRSIEGRDKFVPHMSDLKDSGQLEQDADVIVFLVWPYRLDPEQDPKKYMLFVAKNRNRGIIKPTVTCQFDADRQRLVDEVHEIRLPKGF